MSLPPLSLYIHIPWCVKKCPYCDFNSHGLKGALPEKVYVDALLRDLDQDLPRVEGREIQTVFFGGGTPSLFSAEAIGRILEGVASQLPMSAGVEVTLEANPGTVERGRFAGYKSVGVTRLSIGVQSFAPKKLEVLGRIHSSEEALRAADEAHAAGLSNFNLDLMYGLPKQTLAEALADLEQAVALKPAHLSHYQLTLEPNTLFAIHPPLLPEDEAVWTMQEACQAFLAEQDYRQYEISAYAKPGREARHNLNYWRFGDYLGIGAGAHGKLTDRSGAVTRLWKLKHPDAYLESAGSPKSLGGVSQVTGEELAFEFMLNRLRLVEGFTATEFEAATGLTMLSIGEPMGRALELGLLETDDLKGIQGWKVSSRGHNYLNDLQSLFLPAKDANRKASA